MNERYEQLRKHQIESYFSGDTNMQSLIDTVGGLLNECDNEPAATEKLYELENGIQSQMREVADVITVLDEIELLLDKDSAAYQAIASKLKVANQKLYNL